MKRWSPMNHVTAAATIVGLITGVASLVFLLRPELEPQAAEPNTPPTRTSARLQQLSVRENVTRAEFLRRTDGDPTGFTKAQLAETGVFVRYRVAIRGFESLPVTVKHEVFDARTGKEVSEESSLTITPPKNAKNIERDWHTWATLPPGRGTYIVVVKLLAEGESAPLATLETSPVSGRRSPS
jgi:hypothetical protein